MTPSLARLAGNVRALWNARRHSTSLTPDRGLELRARLVAEREALRQFTDDVEGEFLDLGTMLRKIASLARQVRDRSDQVMASTSGRTQDSAILFAFQLLKKAEDLVQASREQLHAASALFAKMHVDLRSIVQERSALVRTLFPLETANTQYRIQACALEEHNRVQFFALADAIGGIVKDIQTAVGQRFEELERTGQATENLVIRLGAMAAEQQRETESLLTESRHHLLTLSDVLQDSETASQSISEAGARIAGGVGKAIVALQCQDMARQKIEHICQASDYMTDHLETALAQPVSAGVEASCRGFLADAGRVQLGQLRAVFAQLEEAGLQAGGGLLEIESQAREFAEHSLRSGGATLNGHVIGRAIGSVHSVLSVIENAVGGLRGAAGQVLKLKSTFGDCTSQILGLALRLRISALNAQILAARADAGTALEVVSGNTRTIADQAMRQLDQISFRIKELVDLVEDLEQQLGDFTDLAAAEQEQLGIEAAESERKLRALEQELRSSVAAIGPLERDLTKTIRLATGRIRFPQAAATAGARSTALFEEIIAQYASAAMNPTAIPDGKLQELKNLYTMADERDVHDSAVERSSFDPFADEITADGMSADGRDANEEELAGNVELF